MLYFYRYLRLTPLLGFCIIFAVSLFRFCGSGPFWSHLTGSIRTECEQNWWINLLYLQNYIHPEKIVSWTVWSTIFNNLFSAFAQCFTYSWYLAVDMQLFLIEPAIIYLIHRFKTKTIAILVFAVLGCFGLTINAYLEYDLRTLWVLGTCPLIFDIQWILFTVVDWYYHRVSSSSVVATNIKTFLLNVFDAFFHDQNDDSFCKGFKLFQRMDNRKFCNNFFD